MGLVQEEEDAASCLCVSTRKNRMTLSGVKKNVSKRLILKSRWI